MSERVVIVKTWKNLLWGLALIAVGVIVGLNVLDIVDINLFFDGWWTLFIIVPSVIGLFTDKQKAGPLVGLLIGIAFLLVARGIVPFTMLWKLAFPAALVIGGLVLIFRVTIGSKATQKIQMLNEKTAAKEEYCAVFGGQDIRFAGQTFEGASLSAVFGGVKCDLRGAIIEQDAVLNVSAIFGGVDIFVPPTVKVVVRSTPLFGGVSDSSLHTNEETAPTLYINATCMFGGVDIK